MSKHFPCLKVQQLSVLKTYPKSKSSVKFPFDPTPVARPVTKSDAKSNVKPKTKRRSRHCSKKHEYDRTQKEHINVLLGLLDIFPLLAHYKTKHLLKSLTDLRAAHLLDYVPDCVCHPEPVSLNTINI